MPGISLNKNLEKVVVNAGVGRMAVNIPNFEEKILPELVKDLALITGQKPSPRTAKQSIAGFKIRQGGIVGLKITLRGKRMAGFIEKLVKVVFPRLRDFRGIDLKNIDSCGNLSVGLRDHLVFPEINQETSKINFGLQVTVVPKLKKREAALKIYREIGLPFQKEQ